MSVIIVVNAVVVLRFVCIIGRVFTVVLGDADCGDGVVVTG